MDRINTDVGFGRGVLRSFKVLEDLKLLYNRNQKEVVGDETFPRIASGAD